MFNDVWSFGVSKIDLTPPLVVFTIGGVQAPSL